MSKEESNFPEWTYISYDKIPENPNKWNLIESDYRAFKKTDWVVTEKIHGANFCIITNGEEVRFAKRKEVLQPDEDFFGYQSLKNQLVDQVQEIFKILQSKRPHILNISVYGELFGGEYPHPEVPAEPNVQAIQTGVYYSPKIEYCAFDLAVAENDKSIKREYLDYDKALQLFHQVGMMYTQSLFRGKYEEALTYNIKFESTIPTFLGLPKLPLLNKAEGVVIKPLKSIYVETPKGRIRPILKKKIPEFAEDERFHQATKWANPKASASYQQGNPEDWLKEVMLSLITETRLNNVISKVGRVSIKDRKMRQQVFQLLVSDVLESFNEDYEGIFATLSNKSQQTMIEQLHQNAQKLVNHYFQ